jgi:hypothetical protein
MAQSKVCIKDDLIKINIRYIKMLSRKDHINSFIIRQIDLVYLYFFFYWRAALT